MHEIVVIERVPLHKYVFVGCDLLVDLWFADRDVALFTDSVDEVVGGISHLYYVLLHRFPRIVVDVTTSAVVIHAPDKFRDGIVVEEQFPLRTGGYFFCFESAGVDAVDAGVFNALGFCSGEGGFLFFAFVVGELAITEETDVFEVLAGEYTAAVDDFDQAIFRILLVPFDSCARGIVFVVLTDWLYPHIFSALFEQRVEGERPFSFAVDCQEAVFLRIEADAENCVV